MIKPGDVFMLNGKLFVVVQEKRLVGERAFDMLSLDGPDAGEITLTLESRLMSGDTWSKVPT